MSTEFYPFVDPMYKEWEPLPDGIVTELEEWQADVREYYDKPVRLRMHPEFRRVVRYDMSSGEDELYAFEPVDIPRPEPGRGPRVRFSVRNFPGEPASDRINWGLDLYDDDHVDGFVLGHNGTRYAAGRDVYETAFQLFERYIGEHD